MGPVVRRGDVCEVVRATAPDGRRCVIKRLHRHAELHPDLHAMFARECVIACQTPPHPNLVRGIEAGRDELGDFLVLEEAPGQDLQARREAAISMELPTAMAHVAALARACDHLHAAGWVHGDVNPSNAITDEHIITLCDFGVAQPIGTRGGTRGTHAYMAPEQVRGETWTAATDVFALGVLAWELATGLRLFHRAAPWLSMAAVVEASPSPLADPRLNAIVAAALQKSPADRTPSAGALAAALEAFATVIRK